MSIQDIESFYLESCRFSKGSYTFEFAGKLNDDYRTFIVSTSDCFSLPGEKLLDVRENFSKIVWEFLEKRVVCISVDDQDEQSEKVFFEFEGGGQFIIFSDGPVRGELLVVKVKETGEWFTV